MAHTRKDLHQFTTATILDCLPENIPLYKDSGLWAFWDADMEEPIFIQSANEVFEDFVRRFALSILNGDDEVHFEIMATNMAYKKAGIVQ